MKWDMEPRPWGDPEDVIIVATSSPSMVYKLEPMPFDQQVGELLDRGRIDEALDVVKLSVASLPDDKQRSKLKRFHLQSLRRLQFREAGK